MPNTVSVRCWTSLAGLAKAVTVHSGKDLTVTWLPSKNALKVVRNSIALCCQIHDNVHRVFSIWQCWLLYCLLWLVLAGNLSHPTFTFGPLYLIYSCTVAIYKDSQDWHHYGSSHSVSLLLGMAGPSPSSIGHLQVWEVLWYDCVLLRDKDSSRLLKNQIHRCYCFSNLGHLFILLSR